MGRNQRGVAPRRVDLLLLAESAALVGKFTSNFFRTAYMLRASSCDCATPFVSLDAPWCFEYGKLAGTNPALAGAAMALSSISVVANSLLLARWRAM